MQNYKLSSSCLLKKPSQYTEEMAVKNVLVVGTGLCILISALSEFCQVGLSGFSSLEKLLIAYGTSLTKSVSMFSEATVEPNFH